MNIYSLKDDVNFMDLCMQELHQHCSLMYVRLFSATQTKFDLYLNMVELKQAACTEQNGAGITSWES